MHHRFRHRRETGRWHRPLVWLACACAGAVVPVSAEAQDPAASVTGVSRSFNPAISANALFDAVYTSQVLEPEGHADDVDADHEHEHVHGPGADTGLRVQEVELQLTSMVDPYLKADLILAVPGGEGVELEEGYVTTQGLPGGLLLRVGKVYAELGRHNRLHSHQFPFLDGPLVNERLLGAEGLAEAGLSLSWLTPLPWYVEFTGQVFDGAHELFASDDGEDLLYLGHVRSFWELGEAATLEAGGSAATGANAFGANTALWGADLTYKWRPLVRGRDRSFTWQSEYFVARVDEGPQTHEEGGLYSLVQVQWARRWWVQARGDLFGVLREADERDWRASALLAFVPSEFSALRLQYSRLHAGGQDANQLMLQLNVTIGSHPAHRY